MAEDLRQDGPGELMLMDWRDDRAGRVLMQVGAADAADLRFDQDLFRSCARRGRDLLDLNILLTVVTNGFHIGLPICFLARSLYLT